MELSRALLALGDLVGAEQALSEVLAGGDPPTGEHLAVRTAIAVRQLRTGTHLGDLGALIAEVEGLEDGPATVLGAVGWILARIGDDIRAEKLLERAAVAADRAGMPLNASVTRIYRGQACQRLGRGEEARQAWLEALATAEALGLPPLLRRIRYLLARLEIRLGRLEVAEHHRAELQTLASSAPDPELQATAGIVDAWCELAHQRPEAALAALDGVDPAHLSEPLALAYAIPRGLALLDTGRLAEARQIVDTASLPAHPARAMRLLSLRGRVYLALGRRYLREARDRLPETPRALERQEVGEILLACAGEDLVPDEFADRARDLERAAQLLSGPSAEHAERVRDHLLSGAARVRRTPEAPPFETRSVLGVIVSDPREGDDIETTIAMLDPERNNNLLITGATGVGKRVFAERLAVERLGLTGLEEVVLRRGDPQMLVSMLMGTRKGEFTGALDQRGAIDRAIKGKKALLLDELHTLDRTGQEILLPLLELPRRRFGGLMRSARDIRGPLQIMLATNVDLSGSRWRDLFRSDLWYRMSQLHVHLPPLATRGTEAIYQYLTEMLKEGGFPDPEEALEPRAIYALLAHPWEGNLRELHTVASRISRFRRLYDRRLTLDDLPRLAVGPDIDVISPFGTRDVLEMLELNAVVEALRRSDWNQKAAAERLAISKYRLHRILQKHDLVQWVKDKRTGADGKATG
jgi:transcriptional regulator with AAA-type ATPase domain